MRRHISLASLAVAALTLGACAHGVTTIYGQDTASLYTPSLVAYATQSGTLYTIVRGNPFGPGPGNPEAIAASLQSPGWYPPFRFVTRPMPGSRTDARLVLIFNPVDRTSGDDETCRAPQLQQIRPGGGPVRLQAVFCIGSRYVSHVAVMGPPASSPQDPAFQEMMNETLASLLPPLLNQEINASIQSGGNLSR